MRNRFTTAGKRSVAFLAGAGLAVTGLCAIGGTAAVADPAIVDSGLSLAELAQIVPADPNATPETVALYQNMYLLAGTQWMFGHQMDMAMGYTGAQPVNVRNGGVAATANAQTDLAVQDAYHQGRSATKQAWGVDTAVQGIDLGYLELKGEFGAFGTMDAASLDGRPGKYPASGRGPYYGYDGLNVDGYRWADLVQWTVESYQHGSIVTASWHETNPITYGGINGNLYLPGSWTGHGTATATAADFVLPGGELHGRYEARMDALVQFNEDVTAANGGTPVPILFRPYHEHSGDWFWWGIDDMERYFQPVTYQNYADIFKQVEDYLLDHGVHNFLYEISPDASRLGEPSWLFQDLMEDDVYDALGQPQRINQQAGKPTGADLQALIDLYITSKTWSAAIKATARADLQKWYDEAQTLTPASFHWDEPIPLNNSAVPLDLNPTTGAWRDASDTAFRLWMDSGYFETWFMHKWLQGFPGADYVDLYGIDNYWETGSTNGHQYHPYNGQGAKITEIMCSRANAVAKLAREDKRLTAQTEGSSAIAELNDRFSTGCNNGTATLNFGPDRFPYMKYNSYALTWQGSQGAGTGAANPITGPNSEKYVMAGDVAFYTTPKVNNYGDIEVGVEIPEFPGGLALSFTSAFVALTDPALSADKAWITGGGYLPNVVIEDSRPGESLGWDATITAGPKLTGPQEVDGKALGIAPWVAATAEGQVVTPGAGAAAWDPGFTAGTGFGSSPAGSSRGIAALSGWVSYKIPATVQAGSYAGVMSITVL